MEDDYKQELRKLLYEVNHLEQRIETLLNETHNKIAHFAYLNRLEAAEFFGVSVRQFDRIVSDYQLPAKKDFRGRVNFLKADLINVISFMTTQEAREYRTLGFIRGECDADGRPVPQKDAKNAKKYLKRR